MGIGAENGAINVGEIQDFVEPMRQNPSSCVLFNQILYSDKIVNMMQKHGVFWTREFMIRLNSAHPTHDNPLVHGHK